MSSRMVWIAGIASLTTLSLAADVFGQSEAHCGHDPNAVLGGTAQVPAPISGTVGALLVFAKFPDGIEPDWCDTTSAGWPDGSVVPAWGADLLEDTATPSSEGSLSQPRAQRRLTGLLGAAPWADGTVRGNGGHASVCGASSGASFGLPKNQGRVAVADSYQPDDVPLRHDACTEGCCV